jgi:hypothetical protein
MYLTPEDAARRSLAADRQRRRRALQRLLERMPREVDAIRAELAVRAALEAGEQRRLR